MYCISPSIRIVVGYKASVIYDSRKRKLFEVDNDVGRILSKIRKFDSIDEVRALLKGSLAGSQYEERDLDIIISKLLHNEVYVPSNIAGSLPDFSFHIIPPETPERSKIEISGRCNFRCPHCYASATEDNTEIPREKVLSLIEELASLGVRKIQFTGGEPFLNPNVRDYIVKAREYSMDIRVATNASLLDEELISFLIYSNVEIQVSLYGLSEHTFLNFGISLGQYRKVHRNVEKIAKVAPNLLLLTHTITPHTVDEIDDFLNYARQLNIRVVLGRPFKVGRARHNWEHLKVFNDVFHTHKYFVEEELENDECNCFRRTPCRLNSLDILYNGDVSVCVLLRDKNIILGNIFRSTLRHAWESARRKYLSSIQVDNIPICCLCEYKYMCGGGCMAAAYSIVGKINEPFPFCSSQQDMIQSYYKNKCSIRNAQL